MEEGASINDSFAKYVLKIYSPYISEKILLANDVKSKVALIRSRLKDSFTKEQVDYINSNKIIEKNKSGYFEIPKGNPIATMTVNKNGQGVIMNLVEKNSEGKFVMNRYTSGTHTDIIKKKLSKLNEFDINSNIFTPTDMLLGAAKLAAYFWDGVIKFGGTIEVKGGNGYGGAVAFSFGHAVDPDGNLALYGSIAGFLSMFEALTVAGHPNSAAGENMYILGGTSVTVDLGFTKYRHVYELSGIVNQYDVDASVIDVSIEVSKYLKFRGVTLSCGIGLDAGFGTFSSKPIVWAYTKKDVINAINAFEKIIYIYDEHKKLGRTANIVSNIYVNGVKIKSMNELLNGIINEIYYSFDVYDPDEDDLSNAKPLESILLIKFKKQKNNNPYYYETDNVTNTQM